jgi:hypothetical protein
VHEVAATLPPARAAEIAVRRLTYDRFGAAFALKLTAAGDIASSLAASRPPEPAALLVDFAAAFAAARAGFRDAIKAIAFSPRGLSIEEIGEMAGRWPREEGIS